MWATQARARSRSPPARVRYPPAFIWATTPAPRRYSLSGAGNRLSAGAEYVGYAGAGSFTQSAGANTLSGSLYLGYASGGNGGYSMGGASQLSAASEYIGYAPGTALVQQTGGTNAATFLSIGAGGQYQFSGGTLQAGSGIANQGVFDAANQPVSINAGGIVDLSGGTWKNSATRR